jgi:hypothetical protein
VTRSVEPWTRVMHSDKCHPPCYHRACPTSILPRNRPLRLSAKSDRAHAQLFSFTKRQDVPNVRVGKPAYRRSHRRIEYEHRRDEGSECGSIAAF